jgi:hypothetical protein
MKKEISLFMKNIKIYIDYLMTLGFQKLGVHFISLVLLVFIGLCIYHACEKELPADYHRNWKLEQEDANKVRFGEMSRSQFIKNMNNGKYR